MLSTHDLQLIKVIVTETVSESEARIKHEITTSFKKELKSETTKIWTELKEIRGALNGTISYFDKDIRSIKEYVGIIPKQTSKSSQAF